MMRNFAHRHADDYNRNVREFLQRELITNVSSLVSDLASGFGHDMPTRDLSDLCEQAFELAAPVLDYETAAREAGWKQNRLEYREGVLTTIGPRWWYRGRPVRLGEWDISIPEASTAQEACKTDNLEPHEREVFELWAVDRRFAQDLEALGEKVDYDFAGHAVWARTTTGQAIHLDSVVQDAFDRMQARVAAPMHDDAHARA